MFTPEPFYSYYETIVRHCLIIHPLISDITFPQDDADKWPYRQRCRSFNAIRCR
jgi:hypothetical protein